MPETHLTEIVAIGVALALTVLLSFEVYHFNHMYRRATGDQSYSYMSSNRWRLLSLVLRRHPQPELTRMQLRIAVVAVLWLISVVAVFVRTRY